MGLKRKRQPWQRQCFKRRRPVLRVLELVGRGTKNSGALVWKAEHRHRYGDVAPGGFGLGELGYVGVIGGPYSNQGTRLTNLYWRQRFNDGEGTLIGGYLDVTDYVDTFGGGSPGTGFINLAFSTGSASMFLPNDATLGLAAGAMLTETGMWSAGSRTPTRTLPTPSTIALDRLFNDSEHFMTLELGWTGSQERIFLDNTHVTLWRVDDSVASGAQEGWGRSLLSRPLLRQEMDAFRQRRLCGRRGSLLQKSLSVGVLRQQNPGADL